MNYKQKQEIAIYRYGIIAPLITGQALEKYKSKNAFFKAASSSVGKDYDGQSVNYAPSTIKGWYLAYMKEGFDGLLPKSRSDNNHFRKIDEDISKTVTYLIKEYPRLPATLIYEKLIANGTINQKDVSLSTITRYVNSIKEKQTNEISKQMLRYEKQYVNELWCGDSSVGPYLRIDGQKIRTYIIALIDDASRMIVGINIFFEDNFVNLLSVIRSAVIKHGKPAMFNFDNGSSYRSLQMNLLAGRLGSVINYNPVHTPTSKAKVERFFRTLKDHWMAGLNMNDFKSLDELRQSLMDYIFKYNSTIHSSLDGLSPINRFFKDSSHIIRLKEEDYDKVFLLEDRRKVSADNVVLINNVAYEVDYKYANQKILLRYSSDLSKIYVVDESDNSLKEIKLLKKIENSEVRREKVRMVNDNA